MFCRKLIKLDMGRYVANYHLDLAQLWRCPVSWCTQWKDTPQDWVSHLCQAHAVPHTMRMANLGKWFPPWTVSRKIWRDVLQPHVSGVSTDILLFSERGAPLIHHYRVFGGGGAHNSLHGNYMIKLRVFAALSEAAAHWARHRDSAHPAVTATSPHSRKVRQRDADVDLPRRKSRRVVSPCKPDASAVPVSSFVPKVDIYDGRQPILPVRLQLSDFPVDAVSSLEDSFASVTSPASVFTHPGGPSSSLAARPASSSNVCRVSPVLMIVSEPGVMSEFSSDMEPDLEDKLRQLQPLPAPVSPVSTVPSL